MMKWIFLMVWACGISLIVKGEKTVASIAKAGDYYASNQAKRMINEVIEPTYIRIVELPQIESNQLVQQNTNEINAISLLFPSVKAIPNPAKEQTVFHYQLPEKVTNGEIVITNLFGQVIERIVITEGRGSIIWTTAKVVDEIIIYSLIVDGKIIDINRLVLIK